MSSEEERRRREARERERRREAERNAVRAEIRREETRRDGLQSEINIMQEKIDRQQEAKAKFEIMQNGYEDGRQLLNGNLKRLSVHELYIKMLPGHENMMGERVYGPIAEAGCQRLEGMLQKMIVEIEKNLRCLEELNRQMMQCNQQINSLYNRLSRI